MTVIHHRPISLSIIRRTGRAAGGVSLNTFTLKKFRPIIKIRTDAVGCVHVHIAIKVTNIRQ